jgi:hypothetical protein
MSTIALLTDVELDQVTGGTAVSASFFTGFKVNIAQSNQAAANVGTLTFFTVQNNNQSSNIAQS